MLVHYAYVMITLPKPPLPPVPAGAAPPRAAGGTVIVNTVPAAHDVVIVLT